MTTEFEEIKEYQDVFRKMLDDATQPEEAHGLLQKLLSIAEEVGASRVLGILEELAIGASTETDLQWWVQASPDLKTSKEVIAVKGEMLMPLFRQLRDYVQKNSSWSNLQIAWDAVRHSHARVRELEGQLEAANKRTQELETAVRNNISRFWKDLHRRRSCPECKGIGRIDGKTCPKCKGLALLPKESAP